MNHTFIIESNVATPSASEYVDTLRKMTRGKSILVSAQKARIFLGAAKRIGFTITTRKENGTGVRVWFISRKPKKHRCRESRFIMENHV